MKSILLGVVSVVMVFIITGCSKPKEELLTIGITNWVGYSPLFYAQEKGWLSKDGIKLVKVSSLAENIKLYEHGFINIVLGTQYEYHILKEQKPDLKVSKLLDISNGGDMIMSNKSIVELQSYTNIHAYLEVNSVNRLMLEDFMDHYKILKTNVTLHNVAQDNINSADLNKDKSIVIVTYSPFNLKHMKNGFKEIISTKDNLNIIVMDGMMISKSLELKNGITLLKLNKHIDAAIKISKNDPQAYYKVVGGYLEMSYLEYKDAINDIKWINKNTNIELTNKLKSIGIVEN